MSSVTLGVCTIFKNEERFLPEFLEYSAPYVDEMVLVDTGSTDRSLEILKSQNIPWLFYEWDKNFSNAKNFAISSAKSDWLLLIDADERILPEDIKQLRQYLERATEDGIYLPRVSYHNLPWKDSQNNVQSIHQVIRVLRNHKGYQYINPVHEELETSIRKKKGSFASFDIPVHHLGFLDELMSQKIERNTEIIEQNYKEFPEDPTNAYFYANVHWEKTSKCLNLLKDSFANSEPAFGYSVALRIIEWFHEFGLETNGSGEKNSRIYWERLLLKINPKCSLVHFFQGQRAFKNQELQESLRCYRIANESFYKELLYVPFQRETLDRLGVLCAMLGHLDESKEHFYKYRTLFGNNSGVYHQILKVEYISKDFEAFFKCLLDFPSDLQNLEIGKRKEILTMINSLTFDSKQQILELYLLKSGLSL